MRYSLTEKIVFDPQRIVFELPLYEEVCLSYENADGYANLFNAGKTRIDGYCPDCRRESVFHSKSYLRDGNLVGLKSLLDIKEAKLFCVRDATHFISMFLEMRYSSRGSDVYLCFRKVGQVPSHADIANGGLSEFTKVLDPVDRSEVIRANGLAAHGVNIGAFVYLRRVFERLIWRSWERSIPQPERDNFARMRMDEKISALGDAVPTFLFINPRIYSVLSKGIHELDEHSCGQHYELMRMSIILILEQERELFERISREDTLAKLISAIEHPQS